MENKIQNKKINIKNEEPTPTQKDLQVNLDNLLNNNYTENQEVEESQMAKI